MDIAIVVVAYNRCDSLKRLLSSLEKAYYDERVTLIISVDKSNTDVVELFADKYVWPHGEKIVDKHEKNLGLRPHMMSLGKWFDSFDAIIVLEDDIVVSRSFYYFAEQAVAHYSQNEHIAGISLYSFSINYHKGIPFIPVKDEHDAYFMNCAMSWGEVWMRDSWKKFYDWYLSHQEFPVMKNLPSSICRWNSKSWLKYHTRYCIEEKKCFVHPYVSLTTNYADAGEHSEGAGYSIHQVALQDGEKQSFALPSFGGKAVYYDGFFENCSLYDILGYSSDDLCLDLYGEWNNRLNKRYWLTTDSKDYRIIQSYGLSYRPIEANVLLNNPGERIFLYDTSIREKNPIKQDRKVLFYHYRLKDMYGLIKKYGFKNTYKDFWAILKKRI